MRLVEISPSREQIEWHMAQAHIERSEAIGAAVRALGRAVLRAFSGARMAVRRAAGVAEPCVAC